MAKGSCNIYVYVEKYTVFYVWQKEAAITEYLHWNGIEASGIGSPGG